ncbi:DNA ligase 4 [Gloeophyllum trabeum ATCC 11539]|uniref:DNA ligase n=1 Tax=Gloeophyllum trabeum (strain ATCC 11539 / FP-39264 / Madison 617) TaxID=670483 RepID=S7Q9A2_GLOTA|nr:DNA ligase 4 [Gloeophyllum trabeum ATCC 11539]EPQ56491.1 DNA ligase 4 [Gloeophyllum trabeum ATCC 11539]
MQQPTPAPSSPPLSPAPDTTESKAEEKEKPPVENVGSTPFSVLTALFEKLQNERKPEKRRKMLDSWFDHWRKEIGYNLFPVLRLILPQANRERAMYGLKEKNLAKIYIKLIPLGTKDPDAIRLLNWKRPSDKDKASGDFPSVLYEIVSKRSSVIESSLTVDELNDILDELSLHSGSHSAQLQILKRVYNQCTPEDQRWIVRIILKDMQINIKETTVFAVFHPDAQDLYNTCSDLKKVAWDLWDPKYRLGDQEKTIQLFRAFAPMLCKRPTNRIEESVKEMQGRTFYIEEKLDGERIQLHKRGNQFWYCSRKGKDYTYLYGKHVGTKGTLTDAIAKAFDERVDEIILDGEMLVWDPVSERHLPFGTLKTHAGNKSDDKDRPGPCFKVFDLLYLNGMSLLGKSCKFRKRNLRSCFKEIPGKLEIITEWEGKTAKDVRTRMEQVMANRGEGLILKHPDSEYVLNGRNKDWIKVKPEYMDNMGETVDVLVIAGNYGSGWRANGVSTLICGVLDDRHRNDEDDEPKYSSFVRIGSGLSYGDYVWIRSKPWKVWDKKSPPSFFRTSRKGQEDKGDVYLEPQDSFILKVKAAEITPSDQYHLGYTMRFPRALQIRDDLSIADCMTASAIFEALRSEKKRKMDDEEQKTKKKRKTTFKKPTLMPEYKGHDLKEVEVVSDVFEGMTFMVASDPKSRRGEEDKKDLLKLIKAHGGNCVQTVGRRRDVLLIYGGTTTPYDLSLLIKKDTHDILKPQWIRDSITIGEPAPFHKRYYFYATPDRKETHEYREGESLNTESADAQSLDTVSDVKSPAPPESKGESPASDWFKVDKPIEQEDNTLDEESETEVDDDSDNADVNLEEDDDDWLKVESKAGTDAADDMSQLDISDLPKGVQVALGVSQSQPENQDQGSTARMGEDDAAMEYDQERIFRHLCFYLDTPENARAHGFALRSTKHEQQITSKFEEVKKLILDNGGKIVDLDDPKLTHIVIDKRDDSRRVELMKRTSEPKHRRLVIGEYIQACLDEGTLLDEDEFMP